MSDQNNFIPTSLPKKQARPLVTTHKTRPQMEAISSRHLLKLLPWVNVAGGFYRVNRRQIVEIVPGFVTIVDNDGEPAIFTESLRQVSFLRDVEEDDVLAQLAAAAEKEDFAEGATIVSSGSIPTHFYVIASGKVTFRKHAGFDEETHLSKVHGAGHHFGEFGLFDSEETYIYNGIANTKVTVLKISYDDIKAILSNSPANVDLISHYKDLLDGLEGAVNRKGESIVEIFAGLHDNEPQLDSTFVAYDPAPREYELSATQSILKIHTKVADLYNSPFNQTEEQLRLTIEELREKQEDEMVNNKEFGLLQSVDFRQRIHTKTGPPTPDDLDELLSKRRKTKYIFAHPKAIAAFTRECTKRGIYPGTTELNGSQVLSWRGCPILTCNKIPVVNGLTSMIALRTGEEDQGVVGLFQVGLPEEVEPSLSVRYMGINDQAQISYLVTNYFSVAVLVPDALGVLENVEVDTL